MKKEVREGYKMTELGEIPNEWQIKNLEDISYLIDGDRSSRYPGEKDIVEHGILFLSTQNIINSKIVYKNCKFITEEKFDELSKGKLQKNDLIITLRGSIGNVAKFNGDIYDTGFINAQIMIIRSNDINPTYLSKYLISVKSQKQITSISSGSAQPQLTKSELKKLKVIVPSEYEQKKIAEILSTVDEQIENTEKLIKKNQEFKKGLMQQLLTKGIGHTEFKKTELGDIPKEWEIKNLDEISILIDGDRSNKYPGEKDIVENGILFLSTQNIVNSKINYDNCKFISQEKFNELSKGKLKKDDLVITLRGSIGNVAKFNGDVYNTGFINAQIMIIRSKNINSNYLSNYLISDCSQKQIIKISSGSAQPQLTKRELKKIKVIIPSEKEQKKISVILSILDKKLEEYKNKKEKLELLKKGLMQQLLNGNLRVKYSY
ncbi:restriction endonuclease subunit S [Clostridium perfringens]